MVNVTEATTSTTTSNVPTTSINDGEKASTVTPITDIDGDLPAIQHAAVLPSARLPLDVADTTMREIVISWLIDNCWQSTAESLKSAYKRERKPVASSIIEGMNSLPQRARVRELISKGLINDAISDCKRHFPWIIENSSGGGTYVLFLLQCQHFVEYLRNGNCDAALTFATERLGPLVAASEWGGEMKVVSRLKDILSLLAYADPATCPMSHYLAFGRREELADIVNSAAMPNTRSSSLPQLCRQVTACRSEIREGGWSARTTEWNVSVFAAASTIISHTEQSSVTESTPQSLGITRCEQVLSNYSENDSSDSGDQVIMF